MWDVAVFMVLFVIFLIPFGEIFQNFHSTSQLAIHKF